MFDEVLHIRDIKMHALLTLITRLLPSDGPLQKYSVMFTRPTVVSGGEDDEVELLSAVARVL